MPPGFCPRRGRVGGREKKQAPPTDSGTATSAGDQPGKPPAGRVVCYPAPVPPGFSPRGCKGRSPLHEITLILPLPAGKGVGGMGAGKKTKGRVGGREKRQAPGGTGYPPPRGRGPSQTPPSLATDSSISPGPPSPWLPALSKEKLFLPFWRQTADSSLRRAPVWKGL